jgi:hypothetical protein
MSQSSDTKQEEARTRARIEDIPAVGEELNEEHLRLVSGGMVPQGGMTGCTGPHCFPDFPPGW